MDFEPSPVGAVNPYSDLIHRRFPQAAVYQLGVAEPPGMAGKAPGWQVFDFLIPPRVTQQLAFTLPEGFELIALGGGVANFDERIAPDVGFLVQIYDAIAKRQICDRGIDSENMLGKPGAPGNYFFLREAHPFEPDDSGHGLALIVVKNKSGVLTAKIQVILYGMCDEMQSIVAGER